MQKVYENKEKPDLWMAKAETLTPKEAEMLTKMYSKGYHLLSILKWIRHLCFKYWENVLHSSVYYVHHYPLIPQATADLMVNKLFSDLPNRYSINYSGEMNCKIRRSGFSVNSFIQLFRLMVQELRCSPQPTQYCFTVANQSFMI